jgi:hypothetical protein
MDFRDWFVIAMISAAWVAATVFIFKHWDPLNFATWATFSGTAIAGYHWLMIKDSKQEDASCSHS